MNKLKTFLFLLIMAISLMSVAQITTPTPYCNATFQNGYCMINSVTVQGTTQTLDPMGSFATSSPTYFKYYNTTVFPDLPVGGTATIDINFYAPNDIEPMYYAVWIDFNQNNIFEAAELVMQNSNTNNAALPAFGAPQVTLTKTINIASGLTAGTTRMRVMRAQSPTGGFAYDNTVQLNPCPPAPMPFQIAYGCAFDFNVNLTSGNLPVTFSTFNVSTQGCKTEISWNTAQEVNNDHFLLERSKDAKNFVTLSRVEGAGNSATTREYSITDEQPTDGWNYYRIRQVDQDRQSKTSAIQSAYVSCNGDEAIKVFPTVSNDIVQVMLPARLEGAVIELISLMGQKIKIPAAGNGSKFHISVSHLPVAMYLIRITKGREIYSYKIVKT